MKTRRSGRKASAPSGGSITSIDMLPDGVLGCILAMVWKMKSPGVATPALVSRRWRRVFFSEPGIWQSTSTVLPNRSGPAGFKVEQGMLRRVAPLVHSLTATQRDGPEGLAASAGEQLAATLRVLRAAPLDRLVVDWSRDGLPRQACSPSCLGQLSGLSQLSLRGVRLPEGASQSLLQLSWLEDLAIGARLITRALAEHALPQLTLLTRLRLESSLLLPSLASLSTLRRLRDLTLMEDSDEFFWLPWLEEEQLVVFQHRQRAAEGQLRPLVVPPPAALPNLSSFYFDNPGQFLQRGVQVAPGVELEFCRCEQQQRAGEGGDAVVFQAVHMTWDGTASLAAALEALLRPGLPLEELSLHCRRAFDKQLEACAAALAPLRVLHITGHSHRDCLEESAAAMLARAPALRSLHLMECPLGGGLPPWLVQRRGLDRLVLQCCGITDLPPGPYLQGLTKLNVLGNSLARLPAALTAATALRHLAVGSRSEGLRLLPEDLEVLYALPHLEQLTTSALKPGSRVARALRRARPQLVVAHIWLDGLG